MMTYLSFFKTFFLLLSSYPGHYILGGDLNCVLDPLCDRSTGVDTTHYKTRGLIQKFMTDLNLVDVWRNINNNSKGYSCYSSTHKTYSRIDLFLISRDLLPKVNKCWYDGILLSDHAPISLTLQISNLPHRPLRFIFQATWLQDPKFVNFIDSTIDDFFFFNTDETCASVRWEAFKAFIRGEIMSYTRHKSKNYSKKLHSLESRIKDMEERLYHGTNRDLERELFLLKSEYNEMSTQKIFSQLQHLKQQYYDQGEKPGKLLAWRIRKQKTDRTINSIKLENGQIVNDLMDINNIFTEYYTDLYTSEYPKNANNQNLFLNSLNIPSLSNENKSLLDSELTIEELVEAVNSMNTGKVPGPDGLPIELYKRFSNKLIPHIFNMFVESFEKGSLPQSLRSAVISLLLKPGKSPTDRTSYRPISLMSCDTKILCKVLAKRIEKVIHKLINADQSGFVPGRQAFHNIRRLLNILHVKYDVQDHAVLSLDAEKAFDRIEWPYLFDVLERFGFGRNILHWIKLLYTNPLAQVLTSGQISKHFKLERSTRQGCPLSPLLFLFAIEPLALAVRQSPEITGIHIGGREHHLSLFADDVVLFLSKLNSSTKALNKLLDTFSQFSGYKINKSKSHFRFLNKLDRLNPPIQIKFNHCLDGFEYLGIRITPHTENTILLNYNPLVKEIEDMLERWDCLPISMIGRINLIKMSVLPKLLYLFQAIPLPLSTSFFSSLNKHFTRFIWNNKHPRLRLSLLYLPFERGGLKMPNLKLYYWAANLRSAMFYFESNEIPAWVDIENYGIKLPLHLYMYSADLKYLKKHTKNPFLKNTLTIWHESHSFAEELTKLSQFTPIWGNKHFKPATNDLGFKQWVSFGIEKIGDLYDETSLISFQQLIDKHGLPKKFLFKYLQLRTFIYSQNSTLNKPILSSFEKYTISHLKGKGQLSTFYNILLSAGKDNSSSYLSAWKKDLKTNISLEEWERACFQAQTQTINTKSRLILYKWLLRTYITPVKLHHFDNKNSDKCYKCKSETGTLFHCLWECPIIQQFWHEVLNHSSKLIGCNIPVDAKICLLHIYPKNLKLHPNNIHLLNICLTQAKRVVAMKWKEQDKPQYNYWIKEMSATFALEKLTFIAKDKVSEFNKIWKSFMDFLEQTH